MKRMTGLLLLWSLASSAVYAGGSTPRHLIDAKKILELADKACKAVNTAKYDVAFESTGAAEPLLGSGKASVIATGQLDRRPEKYLLELTVPRPGHGEELRLTGGSDGEVFFVIDHHHKKAYVDMDPAVIGPSARLFKAAIFGEFHDPEPFTAEINGSEDRVLKGTKRIDGEVCYEVYVVYDAGRVETTWFVSKEDSLPRARHDKFVMLDGREASYRQTLSNLFINRKLDEGTFKFKLPEGYAKTDEVAPDFLPR